MSAANAPCPGHRHAAEGARSTIALLTTGMTPISTAAGDQPLRHPLARHRTHLDHGRNTDDQPNNVDVDHRRVRRAHQDIQLRTISTHPI
jgi:hypothetical protein